MSNSKRAVSLKALNKRMLEISISFEIKFVCINQSSILYHGVFLYKFFFHTSPPLLMSELSEPFVKIKGWIGLPADC